MCSGEQKHPFFVHMGIFFDRSEHGLGAIGCSEGEQKGGVVRAQWGKAKSY